MRLSGITFVHRETIAGIERIQRDHLPVPRNLRQNRGGTNNRDAGIATDHRLDTTGNLRAVVSIDQQMLCRQRQRCDRPAHSQQRRLQDIDAINLFHLSAADGPGESTLLNQSGQRFALIRFQLLESAIPETGFSGSSITAAAITGPASGPRPASSTPAVSRGYPVTEGFTPDL